MLTGRPAYAAWESIDYDPVIPLHVPEAVMEVLPPTASLLEIGCHDGAATCYVARARPDLRVCGVDINADAIERARRRAHADGLTNATFYVADALAPQTFRETFDCVMTLRVLTCFSEWSEWLRLVESIERLLHSGGHWYAIDYLFDPSKTVYTDRYKAAEAKGGRLGNFNVDTKAGELMFVAHHHTNDELALLSHRFQIDRFRSFDSLSMNGNEARMFELLARRPPATTMSRYPFAGAPAEMRNAAAAFRSRFAIEFDTLTYFPEHVLHDAHRHDDDEPALMSCVSVASERDLTVLRYFDVLSRVANVAVPTLADRASYFAALKSVYSRLDKRPRPNEQRVIIAPEREGRILAESLGWLRREYDQAPHAKRIPFAHGLLVGVGACCPIPDAEHLAIVDGAIASGATIIALLEMFARPGTDVDVYSVHATREGLRAILRFAAHGGLVIRIHVGHVTDGLSTKFYAVDVTSNALVVGDLGDTIEGVASTAAVPR